MEAAGYHSYKVKGDIEKKKSKTNEILNDRLEDMRKLPHQGTGTLSSCPSL